MSYYALAVWISAVAAIATLLYHIAICIRAYRRITLAKVASTNGVALEERHYTAAGLAGALILLLVWIISFGMFAQVTAAGMQSVRLMERHARWNVYIQLGGCIAVGLEILVMGSLAVVTIRATMRDAGARKLQTDEDKFFDGHQVEITPSKV